MLPSFTIVLTLSALSAADGPLLPASPESWLSPEGRSAEWIAATAGCQILLGKVDFERPVVNRNRKKLEATVELLRRTETFDWRRRVAVDFLRAMLEDFIAGADPNRRYAGRGVGVP